MTMQLIETKTLTSTTANVQFTSIPQIYDDLVILLSLRSDDTNATFGYLEFNTGGTYTRRRLLGTGSSVLSDTPGAGTQGVDFRVAGSGMTANTFSNDQIYIPNYKGSTAKSYSSDSVNENNATAASQQIIAGLWDQTAAITSIKFYTGNSGANSFVAGSTISIYGITKGSDGSTVVS